jgi:dTDP-4-dehydrorhamnose 3,5-epimerase
MKFTPLSLSGVFTIEPELREDARGAFARTFCVDEFAARGLETQFVQANQSWNTKRNTLRGLHFQYPPFAEVKFLRCIVGSVWDVIIDIRKGSPTFLQHLAVELSAKNKVGLYIPAGFARRRFSLG